MRNYILTGTFILIAAMISACNFIGQENKGDGPSEVKLQKVDNKYQLLVNGQPFFINGAGLEGGDIEKLAAHGGNAMRTWRTDNRFRTGQEVLDEAHKHGVMVCMGIEIARERHGFDYDDTAAVNKQFRYVKGEVLKYKDHPALLSWGIGNELNLHYTNPKVWDAVNEISEMIHEIDSNHPTTTMLAGAHKDVVSVVLERCPDLDYLSFQLYGDIVNLPKYIEESNYQGAYVVSEWGATGHWEVARTSWGRPIEQTSSEKAEAYLFRYNNVIANNKDQCLGSFVFLWGQKQERTPTWYGMILESGEDTESTDVMQYVWTGEWPENRCPELVSFHLNGHTPYDNITLKPGETIHASVVVKDPDRDTLNYRWEILQEVPENMQSDGGDLEQRPQTILMKDSSTQEVKITLPKEKGVYRLFIYAFDGNNNAATANIPFQIG